jgi:hypothetical protein
VRAITLADGQGLCGEDWKESAQGARAVVDRDNLDVYVREEDRRRAGISVQATSLSYMSGGGGFQFKSTISSKEDKESDGVQ